MCPNVTSKTVNNSTMVTERCSKHGIAFPWKRAIIALDLEHVASIRCPRDGPSLPRSARDRLLPPRSRLRFSAANSGRFIGMKSLQVCRLEKRGSSQQGHVMSGLPIGT